MAAIAVKSFIRKARQNAARHWYVINQWDEYREIGHGDNLFVIQHKYIDYVAYIILLRQVEKMQPFQFIFSFGIFEQQIIISWSQVMKIQSQMFSVFLFFQI